MTSWPIIEIYQNWYFGIRHNTCAKNCALLNSLKYLPTLRIIDSINHTPFTLTIWKLIYIENNLYTLNNSSYMKAASE